jgi:hypothetical protein
MEHSIALAVSQAMDEASTSDSVLLFDLKRELSAAESERKSQVGKLSLELEQMKVLSESLRSELDALRSLTAEDSPSPSPTPRHAHPSDAESEAHATRIALELSCGELERSQKECMRLLLESEEAMQALSYQKSAREAAEARERESSGQKSKLQDQVIKVCMYHATVQCSVGWFDKAFPFMSWACCAISIS